MGSHNQRITVPIVRPADRHVLVELDQDGGLPARALTELRLVPKQLRQEHPRLNHLTLVNAGPRLKLAPASSDARHDSFRMLTRYDDCNAHHRFEKDRLGLPCRVQRRERSGHSECFGIRVYVVIRPVMDFDADVVDGRAGDHPATERIPDSFIDHVHELLWDGTTRHAILEHVPRLWTARGYSQFDVRVVTDTARVSRVFRFPFRSARERLPVDDLRAADACFYTKLPRESIEDDFKMVFVGAGNEDVPGELARLRSQTGVLDRHLPKSPLEPQRVFGTLRP